MKKFTESIESNDLFNDEQNIHNLLVEFGDNDIQYTIEKVIQRQHDNDLYPISDMDWRDRTDKDIRGYVIKVNHKLNLVTSFKRTTYSVGNLFSTIDNNFYTIIYLDATFIKLRTADVNT